MSSKRRPAKRYPLLLYTRMLDRWWPAILLIGLGTLAAGWPFYGDVYTRLTEPWRWKSLAVVGGAVVCASLLMLALRQSGNVQALQDHLRLVTPFLRLNISYRRIRRINTVGMSTLFPPRSLRGMNRDILEPLLGETAVVIELNALPVPMSTLRLFLSPYFFKDRTPHIVILVRDWMGFSTDLESKRTSSDSAEYTPVRRHASPSILSQLPHRK